MVFLTSESGLGPAVRSKRTEAKWMIEACTQPETQVDFSYFFARKALKSPVSKK